MWQNKLLGLGLFALLSLFISSPLLAQEDVIEKRKAFMVENYDELKAIKKAVEQKDYATIQVKAKDIMANMDKVLDYFPNGSVSEKSRAKVEIWRSWDQSRKMPLKVKDMAGALENAPAAKDEAGVQAE